MHSTVLGEWRGLLALIGLKERRKYQDLKVLRVDLATAAQVPGSFASVLNLLMPLENDVIAPDTTWRNFHLLRWQMPGYGRPRPFALTSPMTLLCAASEYTGVLPTADVPWYNGTYLMDPTDHLSKREKIALAEWVLVLVQKLSAYQASSQRRGDLLEHLRQFASSLARIPAPPNAADILAESEKSLGFQGVFQVLNLPRKAETRVLTDVEVAAKPGAPRYVLIDPTLPEDLHEEPREIAIYGDVTLATASIYTGAGAASGHITENFYWCTPDFFFSDTLMYDAEGEGSFPGCMKVTTLGNPRKRSIVLPLNAAVLTLLTPRTLAEIFTIEWLPDDSAICRLRLLLRSSTGQERTHMIQKVYLAANMVRHESVPMISMWPDFRIERSRWSAYFTFELWNPAQGELSVRPWSAVEPEPAEERILNLDGHHFQIYRTNHPPEALICTSLYYNRQKQRECPATGLLLLEFPVTPTPAEHPPVTLGVDFGSTGTIVFQRSEGGSPGPLTFKNRIRSITAVDSGTFRSNNRDLFVPSQEWSAKNILSVFHDFGDPPEGANERMVLRDGHILYTDDPSRFISGAGDRNRVKSNLKWGGERERLVAKDFLKQLCLQAAAEMAEKGVSQVSLRYSWPTAFSKSDRHNMMVNWNGVPQAMERLTGVAFRNESEGVDNSEAAAATRYFSDHPGNADITGGAVTFDIGGGTTDLAIWNRLKLHSHDSILFAGRDIFLAPLRRRPELLEEIEPRVPLEALKKGQRDPAFDAHLDAIVAYYGDKLIAALPVKEARPSVRGFLHLLELGLCGLGFFSGLMVRRLIEKGIFQKENVESISIFAGGNGSKMFQWCALGQFSDQTQIHERFANAFRAAADWKEVRVHIEPSAEPKTEVAYGLVAAPLDPDRGDSMPPLSGEQFRIGNDSKPWTDSPDWPAIRDMTVAVDRKLPIFRLFLDTMGHELTPSELDKIGGAVDLRFAQQSAAVKAALKQDRSLKGEELLRKEPIFIMALKKYLEMETEGWLGRA